MLKSRAAERSAPDESVEAVRRRARYRLVGALVLVVIGVAGFPLVFDTQPRPVEGDLAIIIPDKNQVPALAVTSPPVAQAEAKSEPTADAAAAKAPTEQASATEPKAEPKSEPKSEAKPEPKAKAEAPAPAKPEPKAEPKVEPKSEPKVQAKASPSKDEAARARAILEGQSSAVKADGQWVVQVGAFGDDASVKRVRRMLEAGGLQTFTQAVAVQGGAVTRVRLGPYASPAEAERAQAKAKALGFSAAKVMKP